MATPQRLAVVATADLNGDGATDVLGAYPNQSGTGSIRVALLGQCGVGLADRLVPINVPADLQSSWPPALGDFDGDGKVDLVYATYDDAVVVFPGVGDGTFGAGISTSVKAPFGVAAADFDGDGRLDLAVAFSSSAGSSAAAVLLGRGAGAHFEMQTPVAFPSGSPAGLHIGDFDRDGIPDLMVGTYTEVPRIYRGDRQGHLTPMAELDPLEHGYTLFDGDFDHDGNPDAMVCSINAESCIEELGQGDGTFRRARTTPLLLATGDLDGDGFPDVVDMGGIELSQAGGQFANVQAFTRNYLGLGPSFAIGDFAGDGRLQALGSNGDVWRMSCP